VKRLSKTAALYVTAALVCLVCLPARAALINNGGFETGLTGWSVVNQVGSDGTFFAQTGTLSPVTGDPVPAPPGGTFAAMADAGGPGSHVLFQDFIAPASSGPTFLSFDLFIGNRADDFRSPDTLDFNAIVDFAGVLNQQARVDLLHGLTDPFSVSPTDVVLKVFQTQPGDALVSGYTHFSVDITSLLNANANTGLRLRFAEVDNVFTFQLGVDNVSIGPAGAGQAAPEPASYLLVIIGLFGLAAWRRRALVSSP
jgi:hypothetical protein